MKKGDLRSFYFGLSQCGNLKGSKFVYAVTKNMRKVRAELEDLQKIEAYSPEYLEYETKRTKLCIEHAKKDENGQAIMVPVANGSNNKQYDIVDVEAFKNDWEKLKDEYADAIEKRQGQIKDFSVILEQDIDFDLHIVNEEDLPEDITVNQLDSIMPMVKFKEEKKLALVE